MAPAIMRIILNYTSIKTVIIITLLYLISPIYYVAQSDIQDISAGCAKITERCHQMRHRLREVFTSEIHSAVSHSEWGARASRYK